MTVVQTVQVEAIVEIQIGDQSGTTINLTHADTSTSLGLEYRPMSLFPTATGSYEAASPSGFMTVKCNRSKIVSQSENSTFNLIPHNTSESWASRPFSAPTTLDLFAGKGTFSTSVDYRSISLLILLQIVVAYFM